MSSDPVNQKRLSVMMLVKCAAVEARGGGFLPPTVELISLRSDPLKLWDALLPSFDRWSIIYRVIVLGISVCPGNWQSISWLYSHWLLYNSVLLVLVLYCGDGGRKPCSSIFSSSWVCWSVSVFLHILKVLVLEGSWGGCRSDYAFDRVHVT